MTRIAGNCRVSGTGGGMHTRTAQSTKRGVSWLFSLFLFGSVLLAIVLADVRSAVALPPPSVHVQALPACARKYGMPCSACHEAWPKFSPFGQWFKDNGYQMGNDRDAPVFQQPAYWPVAFRTTPQWHRESTDRVAVDGLLGPNSAEARVTTHGFDY